MVDVILQGLLAISHYKPGKYLEVIKNAEHADETLKVLQTTKRSTMRQDFASNKSSGGLGWGGWWCWSPLMVPSYTGVKTVKPHL